MWKAIYPVGTEAEWAFGISKTRVGDSGDTGIGENGPRVGIIASLFLAYVLWKTLGQWMRRSGLGDGARTLLEELAKIKSSDVVLPTGTKEGALQRDGPAFLRCVTEPDEAQKVLLQFSEFFLRVGFREIDKFIQMSSNFHPKRNVGS